MTLSTTRSTRIKKPVLNNIIGDTKPKQAIVKKKKQLRAKKDNSTTVLEPEIYQSINSSVKSSMLDPSEHSDYTQLMTKLEDSKKKRLQELEIQRDHEHTMILEWFSSQKHQLHNEYYFARQRARNMFIEQAQMKLTKIRQEFCQLNRHYGATTEEIERDLSIAKQPYNRSNTPNLTYSDYESRSTTNTPTEESDAPFCPTQ